jgi:hypothetical protein
MANKKYWVAIGEHALFTKDDNHMMYVYPWGQPGAGSPLHSKFVDAGSVEDARRMIHAFIDERLDHELHMVKLDRVIEKKQEKREAFKASPVISDADINQLTIGEFVGTKTKEPRSDTEGVLNLEDLL